MARSHAAARPFLAQLLAQALRFLRYDPNYSGDTEDMEDDGSGADEDDDDGSDDVYSDDEDVSWKVRR